MWVTIEPDLAVWLSGSYSTTSTRESKARSWSCLLHTQDVLPYWGHLVGGPRAALLNSPGWVWNGESRRRNPYMTRRAGSNVAFCHWGIIQWLEWGHRGVVWMAPSTPLCWEHATSDFLVLFVPNPISFTDAAFIIHAGRDKIRVKPTHRHATHPQLVLSNHRTVARPW